MTGHITWADPYQHTHLPHRLCQGFGGVFGHKDMAGKPVISRVLGDEPKVPVGRQACVRQNSYPYPQWPKPSSGALLSASPTYLLFFGWYPQKEMFFSWKKWLHLFPYRRDKRNKTVSLQGKQAGGANREKVGTRGGEKHVGQRAGWGLKEVTLAS